MARPVIGKAAAKMIGAAVDHVFDKVKARFLGPSNVEQRGPKQIRIGYVPDLTLQGLYANSASQEYARPDRGVMESLARVAEGYLDANREKTKAKIMANIDQFLRDADAQGVDTDVETVLGGQLAELFGTARSDIDRILSSESNHARNIGTLEGVDTVAAAHGIEDPSVYFIVARDDDRCDECTRLHLLPDGVTPKVWLRSEVGAGYHKRGQDNPKLSGLHPFCRCGIVGILPGYGFDKSGSISYVSHGHNELERQRDEESDE